MDDIKSMFTLMLLTMTAHFMYNIFHTDENALSTLILNKWLNRIPQIKAKDDMVIKLINFFKIQKMWL